MRVSPPLLASGVALTFDDGPSRAVTEPLLDVLRDLGVPATFFITGSEVEGCEDLVVRMQREGHVVASHGWDHVDLTGLYPDAQRTQLERGSELLLALTGARPTLFRAPYGHCDPNLEALTSEMGLGVVNWSVEGADWEDARPEVIASRILDSVTSGDVVLLHDGRKGHLRTGEVVALLVPELRSRGLEVVAL